MTVWRTLYERYCEGDLEIKPPRSVYCEKKLRRLENSAALTDDKAREKFENEIAELCIDAEKRGFYAAVKIILRLISE